MSESQLDTIRTPLREVAQSSCRDFLGIAASIACAVHCTAMPLAIGYLPLLGIEFLAAPSFHKWMVLICFGIALAAFVPGWKKHGRFLPATVGTVGLCIIAATAFFGPDDCCAASAQVSSSSVIAESATHVCNEACCLHLQEETTTASTKTENVSTASIMATPFSAGLASWLTPLGGLLLVGAHLTNHRFNCRCGCCSSDNSARGSDASA